MGDIYCIKAAERMKLEAITCGFLASTIFVMPLISSTKISCYQCAGIVRAIHLCASVCHSNDHWKRTEFIWFNCLFRQVETPDNETGSPERALNKVWQFVSRYDVIIWTLNLVLGSLRWTWSGSSSAHTYGPVGTKKVLPNKLKCAIGQNEHLGAKMPVTRER